MELGGQIWTIPLAVIGRFAPLRPCPLPGETLDNAEPMCQRGIDE